jgi:hypothetical protein
MMAMMAERRFKRGQVTDAEFFSRLFTVLQVYQNNKPVSTDLFSKTRPVRKDLPCFL